MISYSSGFEAGDSRQAQCKSQVTLYMKLEGKMHHAFLLSKPCLSDFPHPTSIIHRQLVLTPLRRFLSNLVEQAKEAVEQT